MFNGKRGDLDKNRPWQKRQRSSLDRHAWNSGGRSISLDIGFHLFQSTPWQQRERRCQLGCHFEDGPPSFASFLRLVMVGQQPPSVASAGHSLPVHLHLHARQTDIEITVSTSAHGWTHGEGRNWYLSLRTYALLASKPSKNEGVLCEDKFTTL